jgi:hypothetical protein
MKCRSHPLSSDAWFDAERVRAIGVAFDNAWASSDPGDAHRRGYEGDATRVAQRVIAAARRGERDAVRLYDIVILAARAA